MQDKSRSKGPDEMPYIYERVVATHRRKQIRNLFMLVLSAVVFGCIAGGCQLLMMRLKPKESAVLSVTQDRNSQETDVSSVRAEEGSPLYAYEQVQDAFVTIVTVYGTEAWGEYEPSTRGFSKNFGVIVAESPEEYYILTELDVIQNADFIYMEAGAYIAEVSVEGQCIIDNIAVISVEKSAIPEDMNCRTAMLGSSEGLIQGDCVIAAGSPYAFVGSVNFGNITYIGTEEIYDCSRTMIYSDMASSAECAGVLLDSNGDIVAWISESTNGGIGGVICGAVIEELHNKISRMIDGESIAWLGITGQEVKPEVSETHEIPDGFYITGIAEDSPAKLAGLQRGDFVDTIDGQPIRNSRQLEELLAGMDAGDSVTVALKRMVQDAYETMSVDVLLGER